MPFGCPVVPELDDLTVGGLTAELPRDLAHLSECLRGDGFTEASESAARVDRQFPTQCEMPLIYPSSKIFGFGETKLFDSEHLSGGHGIVYLGNFNILRADTGHLVGLHGNALLSVILPGHLAAPQSASGDRNRRFPGYPGRQFLRAYNRCRSAVRHGGAHVEGQRPANDPGLEDLFHGQ